MKGKSNKNLEIMAAVGNGGGVVNVPNRDSFYWIRLVNDDNRLTQCFCDVCALADGDLIYVARAKDEKLSYYEFTRFIQNADGDTTDPPICPKFAQVVYVSENSCQFNTVGAAVTYINALVTGPAAGRLFLIKCQAGNFGEAGDVTIPQYVHLEGVGEASELEMGANTLILSGDTSVSNIVVESSDPADAIRMNGVSNVVLRNVRGIQGEAADVFHVYGASLGIEMYGCIAEATVGNAVGFHVGDTADVYLDNCIANDPTNFADALLLDATLCAAVTRRCTFIGNGDDVQTGANSVWYHLDCHFYETNCTLAAGTHYADPTKRFNQTLVVAEYGGDFQALSEAITFINAQGDAAAGKLYGVLVLHGNFGEGGDVTIPQYVHVLGSGEGSEIEMGANTLNLSSDSSLQAAVVESSDPAYGVRLNGATGVELDDVKIIMSAGGDNIEFDGASSARLRHVILERSSGGVGFDVRGTASVKLFDCEADDTTNISVALQLAATACSAETHNCVFKAATDDVSVGAGSTWVYHGDDFDYRNCTIAGTAQPADGQPIIWFDYTVTAANAAAITNAINWVKGRTRVGDYTINVSSGSHDVGLEFIDIPDEGGGNVILQGDTRVLAGLSYVSGPQTAAAWAAATPYAAGAIVQPTAANNFYYKCQVGGNSGGAEPAWPTTLNATVVDNTVTWICCGIPNNRVGLANGGVQDGVCMITSAAFTLTVTMTTQVTGVVSNPNFANDGWQNGDTIIAMDNAGAIAVHTITGVAGNVLTIGAGAPAMGNLGTAFTLLPNRAVARTVAGPCVTNYVSGVKIDGIFLDTATGANCHGVDAQNGYIELENVAIRSEDNGINLHNDAFVKANGGALSLIESYYGIATLHDGVGALVTYAIGYDIGHSFVRASHGYISAEYAIVSTAAGNGYFAGESENIIVNYAYALDCAYGFFVRSVGSMNASSAVAEGCTTAGFATLYFGGMICDSSAARNCLRGYWGYYNSYMYATSTVANCAGNTTNHSPAVTDTEGNVYAVITFS